MRTFVRSELSGWTAPEACWLFLACAVLAGLSVYWGDSWMGIVSATSGVACVVLTGKGKLSAYLFGLVNCVLYSIISYRATLYGETMLNALYYIPMQFVGFALWRKHFDAERAEVIKRRMRSTTWATTAGIVALATVVYGVFLKRIGDATPFVDAFTTVASVAAMALSVKRFAEQWHIWVAVDVFSVYMWALWALDLRAGSDNWATLLMWCVYLMNAVVMLVIVMLVKWEKEARRGDAV